MVKLFDNTFNFKVQVSKSFSLIYWSRLIVWNWILLGTKIHTPPRLYVCLQKEAPKVYWLKFTFLISSVLKWCSVKQMTWDALGDTEFKNSSVLLEIPHMFWLSIVNLFTLQCSYENFLLEWLWFL